MSANLALALAFGTPLVCFLIIAGAMLVGALRRRPPPRPSPPLLQDQAKELKDSLQRLAVKARLRDWDGR